MGIDAVIKSDEKTQETFKGDASLLAEHQVLQSKYRSLNAQFVGLRDRLQTEYEIKLDRCSEAWEARTAELTKELEITNRDLAERIDQLNSMRDMLNLLKQQLTNTTELTPVLRELLNACERLLIIK